MYTIVIIFTLISIFTIYFAEKERENGKRRLSVQFLVQSKWCRDML